MVGNKGGEGGKKEIINSSLLYSVNPEEKYSSQGLHVFRSVSV